MYLGLTLPKWVGVSVVTSPRTSGRYNPYRREELSTLVGSCNEGRLLIQGSFSSLRLGLYGRVMRVQRV